MLVFAISGVMRLVSLKQGFAHSADADNAEGRTARPVLFLLWIVLYAFVGTQMAWTLSPFIGSPAYEFILFRQVGGNFYGDVLNSFFSLLGNP